MTRPKRAEPDPTWTPPKPRRTILEGDRVFLAASKRTVPEEGRRQMEVPAGTAGYVERAALDGQILRVVVSVAGDQLTDVVVAGLTEVRLDDDFRERCPDCDAAVGEAHVVDCDVERCTVCGGQRLGDAHEGHDPRRARWTGLWPGVEECRVRGWYARYLEGSGWTQCGPDAPGAMADLNRWAAFTQSEEGRRQLRV